MDTRKTEFVYNDASVNPCGVGKRVKFDDYVWEVESVNVKENRVTLKPIGPDPEAAPINEQEKGR